MKIITTTLIATSLLIASSGAMSGDLTAEREARTQRIEALNQEVSIMRKNRSATIEDQLKLARIQAEIRKERRQLDRLRDKAAALKRRG